MKLKKIVSLALAGVLAVSMLTACGSSSTTGGDDTVVTTSSSTVEAANDQDASNSVKVTFTASSKLTDALKSLVAAKGDTAATTGTIGATALAAYVGKTSDNLLNGIEDYANLDTLNGKTRNAYTVIAPIQVGGANVNVLNEDAALAVVRDSVNGAVAILAEQSRKVTQGTKYLKYSYTGEISDLVTMTKANGETYYFVAYVISQTATKAEA